MKGLLAKLREMRPSLKSLIFLYWTNALAGGLVGVFTQIYLYQKFTSVPLNISATIVFYTGLMIGFCGLGFLATMWRLNIKRGFMASLAVSALAILYMLQISSVMSAYLAMGLWGAGQGIFWLTVNTFELSETKDRERDFYSSVLNSGNQILGLAGPALATLLLWFSGMQLHLGTYTLLFTVAPLIYLLGFFSFSSLRDYYPPRLVWADITHFFRDGRNRAAQLYTLGMGIQQTIGVTIPPLAILFILGTALKVGVYNTYFAVFSAICILVVARYRTTENRLLIYGLSMGGLFIATVFFGYWLTFAALVLYTVLEGILSPIMNVSTHVIDLNSMEIGRKETDFYATMLLRDVLLWVCRCAGGVLLLFLLTFSNSESEALTIGLYLHAGSFLLTYLGAFLLVKRSRTMLGV